MALVHILTNKVSTCELLYLIVKKMYSVYFNMSCLTNAISMETKLNLYSGYFHSMMYYRNTTSPPRKPCKPIFRNLNIFYSPLYVGLYVGLYAIAACF